MQISAITSVLDSSKVAKIDLTPHNSKRVYDCTEHVSFWVCCLLVSSTTLVVICLVRLKNTRTQEAWTVHMGLSILRSPQTHCKLTWGKVPANVENLKRTHCNHVLQTSDMFTEARCPSITMVCLSVDLMCQSA